MSEQNDTPRFEVALLEYDDTAATSRRVATMTGLLELRDIPQAIHQLRQHKVYDKRTMIVQIREVEVSHE